LRASRCGGAARAETAKRDRARGIWAYILKA
jgi:hypothetical protein